MINVVILCAGEGERFKTGLKQLVTINNEPLLLRTIRQFEAKGCTVTVITHKPELCLRGVRHLNPALRSCTLETLHSSRAAWSDDQYTVAILGDVLFTDRTVELIITTHCENYLPTFFTDTLDIFAVSWGHTRNEEVSGELKVLIDDAHNPTKAGLGKMWDWFRREHLMAAVSNEKMLCLPAVALWHSMIPVNDETQDFDTQEQYNAFLHGGRKNALLNHRERWLV